MWQNDAVTSIGRHTEQGWSPNSTYEISRFVNNANESDFWFFLIRLVFFLCRKIFQFFKYQNRRFNCDRFYFTFISEEYNRTRWSCYAFNFLCKSLGGSVRTMIVARANFVLCKIIFVFVLIIVQRFSHCWNLERLSSVIVMHSLALLLAVPRKYCWNRQKYCFEFFFFF